jgi:hypothetical protein
VTEINAFRAVALVCEQDINRIDARVCLRNDRFIHYTVDVYLEHGKRGKGVPSAGYFTCLHR